MTETAANDMPFTTTSEPPQKGDIALIIRSGDRVEIYAAGAMRGHMVDVASMPEQPLVLTAMALAEIIANDEDALVRAMGAVAARMTGNDLLASVLGSQTDEEQASSLPIRPALDTRRQSWLTALCLAKGRET